MASSTELLWRRMDRIAERWRREREIPAERGGAFDPRDSQGLNQGNRGKRFRATRQAGTTARPPSDRHGQTWPGSPNTLKHDSRSPDGSLPFEWSGPPSDRFQPPVLANARPAGCGPLGPLRGRDACHPSASRCCGAPRPKRRASLPSEVPRYAGNGLGPTLIPTLGQPWGQPMPAMWKNSEYAVWYPPIWVSECTFRTITTPAETGRLGQRPPGHR